MIEKKACVQFKCPNCGEPFTVIWNGAEKFISKQALCGCCFHGFKVWPGGRVVMTLRHEKVSVHEYAR